jgi:Flp pilus assembly protein TadD
MPARTYMQVDVRRDHSLRVPRPDVAAVTGSPTVCAPCHAGTDAAWARAELDRRGALRDTPHPGLALAAGRAGAPGAADALTGLLGDHEQPAIFRATAALLLGRVLDRAQLPALRAALDAPEPLVRLGAVRSLDALAPADRLALGRTRLRDPLRAVRIEAARALVEVPPGAWPPGARTALADALSEYRRAQQLSADRMEGQLNLSALELQLGNVDRAVEHARLAVSFAPDEPAARVNLADALRRSGDEEGAERTLRGGLERAPDSAELELALGLSLVRQGRSDEALDAIGRAYRAAPGAARIAYTWALALQSAGRVDESIAVLEQAARDHPRDRDVLLALVTIERDRGHTAAAARWADALLALEPDDPRIRALRTSLGPAAAPPHATGPR